MIACVEIMLRGPRVGQRCGAPARWRAKAQPFCSTHARTFNQLYAPPNDRCSPLGVGDHIVQVVDGTLKIVTITVEDL